MAQFQKGNTGKPKGAQNKLTKSVKEAFEIAFNELQGDENANLATWAKQNTTEFYKLAAKLIPTSVNADLTTQGEKLLWKVEFVDNETDKVQ
jgi:hypothetical protein